MLAVMDLIYANEELMYAKVLGGFTGPHCLRRQDSSGFSILLSVNLNFIQYRQIIAQNSLRSHCSSARSAHYRSLDQPKLSFDVKYLSPNIFCPFSAQPQGMQVQFQVQTKAARCDQTS